MKGLRYIVLLLVGCCITTVSAAGFEKGKSPERLWTNKKSARTGLYTTKNRFFNNADISLSFNGMYYFGNAEVPGWLLKGGINFNSQSFGGALSIRYLIPQDRHFNMRFSLGAGKLNGDNSDVIWVVKDKEGNPRTDYRLFDSWYIQPSVGVEMYPTLKAGLYFYVGIGLTASFITKFEEGTVTLNSEGNKTESKNPSFKNDSTWSFLPMGQLGIGYSFRLTDSWSLSIEAMLQFGVCDRTGINLDGWPYDNIPHPNNKFVDGWFQSGVTVTYRWQGCQHCRNIERMNNGRNRRGRRR